MSLSSQLWLLPLCDLWGPCRPLRSRSGAGSAARAGPSLSFTGGNCWKGLRDPLLQPFPFTGEDQSPRWGQGFLSKAAQAVQSRAATAAMAPDAQCTHRGCRHDRHS